MNYKNLGNTGVLVSELCFGSMTFGGQGRWESIGKLDQNDATHLVKIAFDHGVNFYDTANVYSSGMAETMLGQALKEVGISRQEAVIATKVRGRMGEGVNQVGLTRLHIHDSVNDSLRRLDTEHIDLLYVHGVDLLTPLEETMRALEDVVRAGKVRYLGVSNHFGWQIVKANNIAKNNHWTRFVAGQHYYALAARDIEREVIPALQDQNMSLVPWSPLSGGFLSGKYTREQEKAGGRRDEFDFPPIDKEKAYDIIEVLQVIANRRDISVARVALAWVIRQKGVTSTIIGAKREDQLKDNLAAVNVEFAEDELAELNEISKLASEYPGWMLHTQNADRVPQKELESIVKEV